MRNDRIPSTAEDLARMLVLSCYLQGLASRHISYFDNKGGIFRTCHADIFWIYLVPYNAERLMLWYGGDMA